MVASAAEDTAVLRPSPGHSEQDPGAVWDAARRVLGRVATDDVDLVAVTAQGDGCWLLDDEGAPVGNALLWNDNRASGIVEQWQQRGVLDVVFDSSGCYGSPGLATAQLTWLRQHQPSTLDKSAVLLSCGSWLYHNLTDREVLHISDAHNPFLDVRTGCYSDTVLDACALRDIRRLLPPVVQGADTVAPLTPAAAAHINLPAGTPVALAPYDVIATTIGAGAIRPGDAAAILGTTMCIAAATDTPNLHRSPGGMTLPTGHHDLRLTAYATLAGTEVLDWLARILGVAGAADVIDLATRAHNDNPPVMLPYLSPAGERAPFLNTRARGVITGLTLGHTQADLANAALDGLTIIINECLSAAGGARSLTAAGGGARSEHWCQKISDATGLPVSRPDTPETGARGAALAGAVAAGHFPDLEQAVAAAVTSGPRHQPSEAAHARLQRLQQRTAGARSLSGSA